MYVNLCVYVCMCVLRYHEAELLGTISQRNLRHIVDVTQCKLMGLRLRVHVSVCEMGLWF